MAVIPQHRAGQRGGANLLLVSLPWVCLIAILATPFRLTGQQQYFGVGLHLTPPVHFEYRQNPYVVASPQPGLAASLTYKREWAARQRQKWYIEAGLTTQTLRYYQVDYTNDSLNIWTDFPNQLVGFGSILFGGGRSFQIGRRSELSMGLEASFLLLSDPGELGSASFSIYHHPVEDAVFPLFLRLNLAYNRELRFFRTFPGQLQVYVNLSAQQVTKGSQYIRNIPDNEPTVRGTYRMNNSELGIKVFTSLEKKQRRPPDGTTARQDMLFQQEKQLRYRLSVAGQLYAPPRTIYHVPQVDSFSLRGKDFYVTSQFGVVAEFPFRKHALWSTVCGLGIGLRAATLVFKADSRFTADQLPIDFETGISDLGYYGIANLGLSRRQAIGRQTLAHTLTLSAVVPLRRERSYLGVPRSSGSVQPPFDRPVLEGRVDYAYGREPVLLGLEYNPEIYFQLPGSFFMSLGLVANYSRGVSAQGHFKVANDRTTYYGAMIQNFSKLGLTLRVGLEK